MIDLRNKGLPSCLEWEGGSCDILTDFRTWIEFGQRLIEEHKVWFGIFPDMRPPDGEEWVMAAIAFYRSPNPIPRQTRTPSNVRAFDYVTDGEFIVASFQQAYGIDLTSCDMHWHRFKALFDGLPDDCKLSKIIGYRMWRAGDEKRKHEDFMREQQAAWALPLIDDEDDMGGFGAFLEHFG